MNRPNNNNRGGGGRSGGGRPGGGRPGGGRPGGGRPGGFREGGNRRRFQRVQRVKRCAKTIKFNYKNPDSLRQYITSHGRIKPMRLNGICAKHQRMLAREIKRARHLALIPFVTD